MSTQHSFNYTIHAPKRFRLPALQSWVRVLGRLRSSTPALFFVPAFLLGQLILLHLVCPLVAPLVALAASILALIAALLCGRLSLVAIAAGACAACSVLPLQHIANVPEHDSSILAQVISEPRFRKVGALEVILQPLANLTRHKDGSFNLQTRASIENYRCRAIHLPWRNAVQLRAGTFILARGTWRSFDRSMNPFSYQQYSLRHGIIGDCKLRYASRPLREVNPALSILRAKLRANIEKNLGIGQTSGLILSLLAGVRDVLSDESEAAFRRTGLAHLTVLSGQQVTLLFLSVMFLLRLAISRIPALQGCPSLRPLCAALAACVSLSAVALTDFEPAAVRAFVAIGCVVCFWTFERRGSKLQNLLVALFVVNVVWPASFLDVGVQLTFAALTGLLLAESGASSFLALQLVWATILASLFTMLVCLFWFPQVSLIGLPLNPIVAPLMAFVVCNLGLPCLLLSFCGLQFPLLLLARAVQRIKYFVDYCASFEWAEIQPSPMLRLALILLICAALFVLLRRRLLQFRQRENLWAKTQCKAPSSL